MKALGPCDFQKRYLKTITGEYELYPTIFMKSATDRDGHYYILQWYESNPTEAHGKVIGQWVAI